MVALSNATSCTVAFGRDASFVQLFAGRSSGEGPLRDGTLGRTAPIATECPMTGTRAVTYSVAFFAAASPGNNITPADNPTLNIVEYPRVLASSRNNI